MVDVRDDVRARRWRRRRTSRLHRNRRSLSLRVPPQDFEGGHIRGCVNITSDRFYQDAEADAIVAQLRGAKRVVRPVGCPRVCWSLARAELMRTRRQVFHCMFSQQRGPFCAGRFAARLQAGAAGGGAAPQVLVLSGGWRGFRRAYGDVEELTEDVQQW